MWLNPRQMKSWRFPVFARKNDSFQSRCCSYLFIKLHCSEMNPVDLILTSPCDPPHTPNSDNFESNCLNAGRCCGAGGGRCTPAGIQLGIASHWPLDHQPPPVTEACIYIKVGVILSSVASVKCSPSWSQWSRKRLASTIAAKQPALFCRANPEMAINAKFHGFFNRAGRGLWLYRTKPKRRTLTNMCAALKNAFTLRETD